jgi:ATP synthase protein I
MQRWQAALRVLEVGWFVGIAIVAGVLGGLWMDSKLGTRPIFVIIGLFLGIATAIYGAVKMIMPILKDDNDKGNS